MLFHKDVVEFIGKPFEYGARGPDKFDCWGLVQALLRKDGIEVPDYRSSSNIAKAAKLMEQAMVKEWVPTEIKGGAILLIRVRGFAAHVGYVLGNPNKFIHAWEDTGGPVIERLNEWQHRFVGAYRYVGS